MYIVSHCRLFSHDVDKPKFRFRGSCLPWQKVLSSNPIDFYISIEPIAVIISKSTEDRLSFLHSVKKMILVSIVSIVDAASHSRSGRLHDSVSALTGPGNVDSTARR